MDGKKIWWRPAADGDLCSPDPICDTWKFWEIERRRHSAGKAYRIRRSTVRLGSRLLSHRGFSPSPGVALFSGTVAAILLLGVAAGPPLLSPLQQRPRASTTRLFRGGSASPRVPQSSSPILLSLPISSTKLAEASSEAAVLSPAQSEIHLHVHPIGKSASNFPFSLCSLRSALYCGSGSERQNLA